jgi:glycosyltransferase involved in cell wall biosynthesis
MNAHPRIALFVPSLHGGGAERVMLTLANYFVEQGVRADLVLGEVNGVFRSDVDAQVRVIDLRAKHVLGCLPGLVRYMRHERPSALLSALTHANIVALWANRLAGSRARAVISERTTLSQAGANARSLRGRLMPTLARLFYPWADVVVAVSHGVADDLARVTGLSQEKIRVIYNPVVTSQLFARSEAPVDHPWFAAGQPPVVLGVGRLEQPKDFATLVRAFSLARRRTDARLVILGEGAERSQLEALINELDMAEEVSLPGFAVNPVPYMKRAGVFVLSSRREGLPNALIEALAVGTPVVSTDCPSGPREVLEVGKWGRLVPVGDVAALASAIVDALQCGQSNLAARAEYVSAQFGAERVVQAYLGACLPIARQE